MSIWLLLSPNLGILHGDRKMNIPVPNKLVLNSGQAVAENWKSFYTQWRNYEVATGLCKKPMDVRVATFLCVIGEEGVEKFESFNFDEEEDKKKIEKNNWKVHIRLWGPNKYCDRKKQVFEKKTTPRRNYRLIPYTVKKISKELQIFRNRKYNKRLIDFESLWW